MNDFIIEQAVIFGLGTIYRSNANFAIASKSILNPKDISKKSDELISARDLAYSRIADSHGDWRNSYLSLIGSYVREGSLFVPNSDRRRIWLRESLVLKNPYGVVRAHKTNSEYVLSKKFNVDAFLEKIGKNNYLILKDTSVIPTNRYGEDERTVFLYQDMAKSYGDLIATNPNTSKSNIYMYSNDDNGIDAQHRPFINQLWIRDLSDMSTTGGSNISAICCCNKDLHRNYRVLGVRLLDDVRNMRLLNAQNAEIQKNIAAEEQLHILNTYNLIKQGLKNEGLIISGSLEKRLLNYILK